MIFITFMYIKDTTFSRELSHIYVCDVTFLGGWRQMTRAYKQFYKCGSTWGADYFTLFPLKQLSLETFSHTSQTDDRLVEQMEKKFFLPSEIT